MTGNSYWSTANGDDTMVTLWNPADEAQNLVFTLFFAGGSYRYPVPLGPRATRTFNVSEIIQNQLPDENGNTIPAGVHEGSAEIAGVQAEQEHILIAMAAGTYNVRKATCAGNCIRCSGYTGADEFDLISLLGAGQTTSATYSLLNSSGSYVNFSSSSAWRSSSSSIATANTPGTVAGITPGTFTAYATTGYEPEFDPFDCPTGDNQNCPTEQFQGSGPSRVTGVPGSELTSFESLYQITAGQFLMTLLPSTYSYDGNSVTESSPVIGSNQCWWSGSGMVQYPVVAGSTWTVATGDAGHNQYGLDTVGFGNGVVNLIQTQGPAHDVEFPCDVYIYQSMNYEGIDLYVTNLLSQAIGSNIVTVCRAGECSGTINY